MPDYDHRHAPRSFAQPVRQRAFAVKPGRRDEASSAREALLRKRWRLILALPVLALAIAAVAVVHWLRSPLALGREPVELSIDPGTSPRDIARRWVQAGVDEPASWLYEWFRWSGEAKKIRAGSYEIEPGTTPIGLLRMMVLGDESLAVVHLIEGWTFRQFRAELASAETLRPLSAGMTDAELMQAIGAPGVLPEGRFYPDTYAYSKGSTDLALLRRAYRAGTERIQAAWRERAPDTPLRTPDEALILASLVEKETGVAADRGRVAGVFVNRLRAGMPLQTDPSVIYGLGTAWGGTLRRRDLLADTPYNTYTRTGLPPTPIAMPGRAALRAAVRPEPTAALYFVSRGDGSSEFSATLADHNRAVNKFLRSK